MKPRAGGDPEDKTGLWGEEQAGKMLSTKGYRILGKRVRLDARDEIDIVARDGETLVFVEVKTRAIERYGRPLAFVDRRKQHFLSRAAVRYLKRKKFPAVCFRFDVVEVVGSAGDKDPTIRHTPNAFGLDRRYFVP